LNLQAGDATDRSHGDPSDTGVGLLSKPGAMGMDRRRCAGRQSRFGATSVRYWLWHSHRWRLPLLLAVREGPSGPASHREYLFFHTTNSIHCMVGHSLRNGRHRLGMAGLERHLLFGLDTLGTSPLRTGSALELDAEGYRFYFVTRANDGSMRCPMGCLESK